MTLTPEQLSERRTMITASEVAAIVGLHPWKGPLEVWLDKRGEPLPESTDPKRAERIAWGHRLEPQLREDYARRHAVNVAVMETLRHPAIRHHGATPDGLVYNGPSRHPATGDRHPALRGWEGKTHSVGLRHLYGPPGTDEVPIHELIQCQWGMHVTDLPRWDLTAFLDGVPNDYVIMRDEGLISSLVARVDPWWEQHVVRGERPEATEADADALAKLWPTHTSDRLELADAADLETITALEIAVRNADNAEQLVERLKARLKERIGEASGISWGPGAGDKITWRKAKDSTSAVTDWQAWGGLVRLAASAKGPLLATAARVLEELAAKDIRRFEGGPDRFDGLEVAKALRDLLAVASSMPETTSRVTKAGSRRFVVPRSWKKAGSDD